jgi:hypothetical protein
MSLSLVSAKPSGFETLTAPELDQLQLEQFQHDETYHREIARLTVQSRLTHMTLHFAKYAGYLAEGCDEARQQQITTDVFVIALSSANILNIKLSDVGDLQSGKPIKTASDFARCLSIAAGRMAAACEKLDHLEDFPFRPVIRDGAIACAKAALAFCALKNWDTSGLVRERLTGIKAKSLFHGGRG